MDQPVRAHGSSIPKWVWIAGLCVLTLIIADCVFVIIKWPFTRSAVQKALESAAAARVEIASFEPKYFPYPGCIARGVVIHRRGDRSGPPLISIDDLTVEGEYMWILTFAEHLGSIRTSGMHIKSLTGNQDSSSGAGGGKMGAKILIDELAADRTTLEFIPVKPGKKPFVMPIHHARLAPVSGSEALSFETDLRVPEPSGEVHATGRFGPWNAGDPFGTPVSGSYTFTRADLSFAGGIRGLLDSAGRFKGVIRRIEVQGSTEVPNFKVRSAHHATGLATTYRAVVSGETGDVTLESVAARFRHTSVRASGAIAERTPHSGKGAKLELSVRDGRIEDFLYLLTQSLPPGLSGELNVRCSAELPPRDASFLRKLEMDGTFHIARARFTTPSTQSELDRISKRSQGEKYEDGDDNGDVLSNLEGHVSVAGGTATIQSATFDVAGASARLSGTYDLIKEEVNLHGVAHLDVALSRTAKGFKSFLLKVVAPFVQKKRRVGEDVPIKITGRWGHTSVALDFKQKL